jgi:hypothetical protein
MRVLVPLFALVIAGCGGVSVTPTPEAVDVSVSVTSGGKPVDDVKFNFQPTDGGLPAVVEVTAGKFTSKVTPGKYTWFISSGKSENSLAAIPAQYFEGSLERQLEIPSGDSIEVKLD